MASNYPALTWHHEIIFLPHCSLFSISNIRSPFFGTFCRSPHILSGLFFVFIIIGSSRPGNAATRISGSRYTGYWISGICIVDVLLGEVYLTDAKGTERRVLPFCACHCNYYGDNDDDVIIIMMMMMMMTMMMMILLIMMLHLMIMMTMMISVIMMTMMVIIILIIDELCFFTFLLICLFSVDFSVDFWISNLARPVRKVIVITMAIWL
jgi:hypothetical protein